MPFKILMIISLTLLMLSLAISSCSNKMKNNKATESTILDNEIIIPGYDCKEVVMNGIDSKVGIITCNGVEITYDLGRYGNKGPSSLYEYFMPTFKNYHYSAFFRKIGMDEKAWKTLRDEVIILDVTSIKKFKGKLDFECENCNAVAVLRYENKIFNYPYQEKETIVESVKDFEFDYHQQGGWMYKRYRQLSPKGSAGLYAYRIDSTPNQMNLSMTLNDNSDISYKILKAIIVKSPTESKQ